MRWSIVVPVYNEADFLPRTLATLIAQTVPARIVLVDNGSTDDGIAAARARLAESGADWTILSEPRPGQVHALKRGIDAVETELVAICDADTDYPPTYLAAAERLFDRAPDIVATAAEMRPQATRGPAAALGLAKRRAVLALLPRQNHVSGAAQCFRTAALRRAGGYDARLWPYVLKDHELMHRVLKQGRQAHGRDLWCRSSDRRADRRAVRWTLAERIAYHLTPFALKDAFFARLGARFASRGQRDTVLRARGWTAADVNA